MLIVKNYHSNYRWNSLIFSYQKIWSLSFKLATSSISIRTMCFYLDDSPTLSSVPRKKWVCLALHTALNSCFPKMKKCQEYGELATVKSFVCVLSINFGNLHGAMANVLDCSLKVVSSNFSYAITFTFGIISLEKVWTLLFPISHGLNCITAVLLQVLLWH